MFETVARDVLMHPTVSDKSFLVTIGDRTVVFVRTRDGFRAQTVQVGSRSSGLVAITDGLAAGTAIATTNAFLLKAEIEKESAE